MSQIIFSMIIFISGASVMILELVGARIIAPYVGTSIFVWTSLIGVILGSLSLGYYWGGVWADRDQKVSTLFFLFALPAVWIGLTAFVKDPLLYALSALPANIQMKSLLATVIFFAFPNVLLGMVVPYIVKLQLTDLGASGKIVGKLYAFSTLGSIFGTFLAGYFLIPSFGSSRILLFLASGLLLCAVVLLFVKGRKVSGLHVFGIIFLLFFLSSIFFVKQYEKKYAGHKVAIVDEETLYNRVWIYDSRDAQGDLIKVMRINNEGNSAVYLFKNGLVADYLKYYRLAGHFNPDFHSTLMIGGAACSYVKDYLSRFPEATIDVVEIDSKLTELAQKYFGLKKDPRLRMIHQDGRIYLNQVKKQYDVILVDAFNSLSTLPYQLTTKQAVARMYRVLNPEGVVLVNMISAINGERGQFARAEYETYRLIFPQVYLFQVDPLKSADQVQNVMLVALKSQDAPQWRSANQEHTSYLKNRIEKNVAADVPALTDEYAPVEYYIGKALLNKN